MSEWPEGVVPEARFDDCRSAPGHSFRLVSPVAVVEARTAAEVRGALYSVERSVREGLWSAGFVSYEAAPAFDPAFKVRAPADPPVLWFALFERAEEVAPPDLWPESTSGYELSPWIPSVERAMYEESVKRIRALIAAGDTYQVNRTFQLRSSFRGDVNSYYRDLCLAQRSSHSALLVTGSRSLVSSSPELFFRVEPGPASVEGRTGFDVVIARPMKGTTARGRWAEEDAAAAKALRRSKKDRAENAMIVDLVRSDLGRISVPGSVRVPRLFDTERYETVWQMTSTIASHLPAGTGVTDIFAALFPCGSVTGAPKVRTMEAIAELEDSPRGVYTGAIGWIAPPGSRLPGLPDEIPSPLASFNVAIRTVVIDSATGAADYGVGGGITWDSSPAGEYEECRAKSLVLTARRPEMELLETLRLEPGRGYLFQERHLERLAGSAAYFGFALYLAQVRRELLAVARGSSETGPLRVRLTASCDGTVRVKAEPLVPEPPGPVTLAIHEQPVDSSDALLFHKTTLRDRYERARESHPGAGDVLLVNERGEVTESTIANVAARIEGTWLTPPLTSGLLPGAFRAELLSSGRLLEEAITVEDLRRAEEIALVSSVRLWRPAALMPRPPPPARARRPAQRRL